MCKKPVKIDGLHSCLGEEDTDARFGTYLIHSKQDRRHNAYHAFFLTKGATRLDLFLFLFYFIVLLSLLILILKICIE